MGNKNKGNRKEQKKRRRERMKVNVPKQEKVELIDGNCSYYPFAYCKWHRGFLTLGLMQTHRCKEKDCVRLRYLEQLEQS